MVSLLRDSKIALYCIANECLNGKIQLKTLVNFKLDVDKANRKVNLDTLIYLLVWFGFEDKWKNRY